MDIATEIGELLGAKNAAYGDSFERSGDIMNILYPNGINAEQMVDALAIVRTIDKFFRIATNKDAFGENPWRDAAGYCILGVHHHENNNTKIPKIIERPGVDTGGDGEL